MMTAHDDEHATEGDMRDAWDPQVGAGTPSTAPDERPPASLLERQPVAIVGVAQAVATATVTIAALGVPVWAGLLVALGLLLMERLAWTRVTPVADPKLAPDIPLTPVDPSPET